MKNICRTTYALLFQNCYDLYNTEFQAEAEAGAEGGKEGEDTGPRLDDLEFWHKLIALITSVIEEDKNSYGPVLNQFPQELNMGQVMTRALLSTLGPHVFFMVSKTCACVIIISTNLGFRVIFSVGIIHGLKTF